MSDNQMIPHPEVQRLLDEREFLRAELARKIAEAHDLIHVVKPNLLALYQLKIGAWELRLLKLQFDVARSRRKIALAQASLNHGLPPDWMAIDGELELEFLQWQTQLREAANAVEAANFRMNNLLPDTENRELKKLYYALVKKLHPDINPTLTPREALLWVEVQEAYESCNIAGLRALLTLTENRLPEKDRTATIPSLQSDCTQLREHIDNTLAKIAQIQTKPPFNMRDNLEDEQWVKERRNEIDARIAEYETQREALEALLENLNTHTKSDGFQFGSN